MEKLVLVNEKDEAIGLEEKVKCHQGKGIFHRAFTILLFDNKGQILIQKRGVSKMLWPMYWEATCSSHPQENETYEESGERRLEEELRIKASLKLADKFIYHLYYKDIGAEHELCATLVGQYDKENIDFNTDEVKDVKWITINELKQELNKNPQNYAPWLGIALERLFNQHGSNLENLF
ncbi:MAG: isopentenyl-diphosphate Delta-isomerase [Candidatus Nealsonbacteria bacterium]